MARIAGKKSKSNSGYLPTPVSYTHLDVYKRQTSSRAEKGKYDEKALCRFMGKMMFLLAACFLITILSDLLGYMAFLWIGWGLFLAVIVFMLIYSNTGNRFKK